jgi:hypothetical protein
MQRRERFTVGKWVGTIILFSSTIPGLSLAGFRGGTAWSLFIWLPIAAVGGLVGGALLAPSHRLAGALGGLVAAPSGLLALFFYARGRDKMFRAEIVIIQLVASLPGPGVFFLVRLITDALSPPPEPDKPRFHAHADQDDENDQPRSRRWSHDTDDDEGLTQQDSTMTNDNGPRSGKWVILAVLNFGMALLLLPCSTCVGFDLSYTDLKLNNQDAKPQLVAFMNSEVPGFMAWKIGGALVGYGIAAGMVAGGAGLILGKPWGRTVSMAACILGIAHHVLLAVVQLIFIVPAYDKFFDRVFRVGPLNLGLPLKIVAWVWVVGGVLAVLLYGCEILMLLSAPNGRRPTRRRGR